MELQSLKIGANIAALRKEKGFTQEQLAAMIGVSAPAVSKWETGNSLPRHYPCSVPLARALGTHVDTLLQFEETLSDQEVTRQVNAVIQTAHDPKLCRGGTAAPENFCTATPTAPPLQFNAALAYDTFQMVDPAGQSQWRSRKRALLEEVRASGSGRLLAGRHHPAGHHRHRRWRTGTGRDFAAGTARAARRTPAPSGALYYLKKDQPEEALKRTQKQLYKLANQMVSCLATLMNPKTQPPAPAAAENLPGLSGPWPGPSASPT